MRPHIRWPKANARDKHGAWHAQETTMRGVIALMATMLIFQGPSAAIAEANDVEAVVAQEI
jgi:hypothetical protein